MKAAKLSRRGFLAALGLAGGALAAGGAVLASNPSRDVVEGIIRKRLPGVVLAPDALDAFLAEFTTRVKHVTDSRRWRLLAFLLPIYGVSNLLDSTPLKDTIYHFEREVVSALLLSTDFFTRDRDHDGGAAGGPPLRYVAWYSDAVCAGRNPFARMDFD